MSGPEGPERPASGERRVAITPEETRLLREIVEEYCGVSLATDSGFLLERRLATRLVALGLTSFLEYYHYLRYDLDGPEELVELVERITTHETYLFREQFQLDVFSRSLTRELATRHATRKSLSFWSAGCSTGEEAYTIAILLRELPSLTGWTLRVVGSDISDKVLASARAGVYGESSFRVTDPALRARYFEQVPGGERAIEAVRRMCSFHRVNLLNPAEFDVVGTVDVIFCRNVLIYLTPAARHQIVEAFYDTLSPGGFLLLGHSENLLNVNTRFEHVHFEGDLVYRRPLQAGLEPADRSAR